MLHLNLRFSVIKFVQDFIAINNPGAVFCDFDAPEYSDETKLPSSDIVGIRGFSWSDDDGLAVVTVMFVVSTYNDLNLFRQTEVTAHLADLLMPGGKVEVVDTVNNPIGWMVARSGTDIMPMVPGTVRTLQPIGVTFDTNQSTRR